MPPRRAPDLHGPSAPARWLLGPIARGLLAMAFAAAAAGCPPQPLPEDAGGDAATDAASRADSAADAGPPCALECSTTLERCCFDASGVAECIDVANDVSNCGLCGLDCVATRRGDRCATMQCACGDFPIGCTGNQDSICCPPAPDGRSPRCANLGRDFSDCGECGRTCTPATANRCEGGLCSCGTTGSECAGTRTSLCCVDLFAMATCVDTTVDKLHCGACNRACGGFEDCIDGRCIDFTLRDAGPFDGGSPPDAGSPPGASSPPDAGSPDAGALDATSGTPDAG